jgi:hypothetical protein
MPSTFSSADCVQTNQRIIDNVPRVIDAEVFMPLSEKVRNALLADLDILSDGGEERCRAFFAEKLETTRLREDLLQKQARLGRAKEALRKFSVGSTSKRPIKR